MLKITTTRLGAENTHYCAEKQKNLLIKELAGGGHEVVSINEVADNAHGLDEIITRPEKPNKANVWYNFYYSS